VHVLRAGGGAPTGGVERSDGLGERWGGGDAWPPPRHILFTSSQHLHHWHNTLAAIVRRRRLEALTLGCARRRHSKGALIKMFAVAIVFQRSNSPQHHIQPGARNNDVTQGRE